MNVLDFLINARKLRVGKMLRVGPIRTRLDGQGLSFTEFSYQIMQAYDWNYLAQKHECLLQVGGSDQLGNFEIGHEYIRDTTGQNSVAICLPLLIDRNGNKLGKSENSDNIWLDSNKTSLLDFYQFFRQLHDDDAEKLFRYLSLKAIQDVESIIETHKNKLGQWVAQQHIADEMTSLVHGVKKLQTVKKCSDVFYQRDFGEHMDRIESIDGNDLKEVFGQASTHNLSKAEVSKAGQLAESTRKNGAKDMLSGSFRVNGKKYSDPECLLDHKNLIFKDELSLISWGKRNFQLVCWK